MPWTGHPPSWRWERAVGCARFAALRTHWASLLFIWLSLGSPDTSRFCCSCFVGGLSYKTKWNIQSSVWRLNSLHAINCWLKFEILCCLPLRDYFREILISVFPKEHFKIALWNCENYLVGGGGVVKSLCFVWRDPAFAGGLLFGPNPGMLFQIEVKRVKLTF